MTLNSDKVTNQTILNYKLSPRQNAYLNYLIPSIISFVLYCLLCASEVSVIVRHYRDENPVWAALSVFFVYFPAIGCYIVTVSTWELWPQMENFSWPNVIWFFSKTGQHLWFPIWAIWRFAERIFWSIEAVRADDVQKIGDAFAIVSAPRNVELYFFLQAFLQSLPQMLFQLALLIRSNEDSNKETIQAEVLSFVFNLTKLSATIAYFHRFKSQKVAGRQYPWYKEYKKVGLIGLNNEKSVTNDAETNGEEEGGNSRRSSTSSGSYLEPNEIKVVKSVDEPDFNIKRLLKVMGLPEDDVAGKLVAFCWWFSFLLARVFAISAFAYFYLIGTISLIVVHFVLVISFLLYDVKTDDLKHSKSLFFIFLGFIYIFCVIEFKVRFKKATFIYYSFFILVYVENFIMCIIWMAKNREELENDFWFRYMFYVIVMCFILGVSSMIFYIVINKPKKFVVKEIVAE